MLIKKREKDPYKFSLRNFFIIENYVILQYYFARHSLKMKILKEPIAYIQSIYPDDKNQLIIY
jgi:hypothetical protein